jgi:hypothetical protein
MMQHATAAINAKVSGFPNSIAQYSYRFPSVSVSVSDGKGRGREREREGGRCVCGAGNPLLPSPPLPSGQSPHPDIRAGIAWHFFFFSWFKRRRGGGRGVAVAETVALSLSQLYMTTGPDSGEEGYGDRIGLGTDSRERWGGGMGRRDEKCTYVGVRTCVVLVI